jgi:hypothetical protein
MSSRAVNTTDVTGVRCLPLGPASIPTTGYSGTYSPSIAAVMSTVMRDVFIAEPTTAAVLVGLGPETGTSS